MNYVVDTHILIFRFLEPKRLSAKHKTLFQQEKNIFLVPTISLLEVQYLSEIKRINLDLGDFLVALKKEDQFQIVNFDEPTLYYSLKLTSTRDPFDRIILAHALSTSTKILTKDRWMKSVAPQLVI